jgi:hypothetical protein
MYDFNDLVEENEMSFSCSMNLEKRTAYGLLVGKPEKRRSLERARCRWVDNITMDLGRIVRGGVDCITLAQDSNKWRAVLNAAINLQVP